MRLRIIRMAAVFTAALWLTGCASTWGLKPAAELTNAYQLHTERTLESVSRTEQAWPQKDWWKMLGDKQLDALIREALADNPNLAVAQARMRQAEAAAGLVRADQLPTVDVSGTVSGAHLPGTVLPAPIGGSFGWMKATYGSFNWNLDLWGGKRAAWEAAVDQVHAKQVDLAQTQLLISTGVARAYVHFGYAFRQQDLAKQELKRAKHARDLTNRRVKAGIDNKLELKQATAEVARGKRQLEASRLEVAVARVALATLLGKGPDRGLDINHPDLIKPMKLALPPQLPVNLLGRRPDVVAARLRVQAAQKKIKSAKTLFLPNISIGAMAGFATKGSDVLLSLPARFFQIGPAIHLPVFEGGKLRANLAGRNADYDLAVAKYNKTLIDAINHVATVVKTVKSFAIQSVAQKQSLKAAQQALTLSKARYKAGVGSYLQALTVRRQLLKAEQVEAELHARQVNASIELIQALGGGFVDPDSKQGPQTKHVSFTQGTNES